MARKNRNAAQKTQNTVGDYFQKPPITPKTTKEVFDELGHYPLEPRAYARLRDRFGGNFPPGLWRILVDRARRDLRQLTLAELEGVLRGFETPPLKSEPASPPLRVVREEESPVAAALKVAMAEPPNPCWFECGREAGRKNWLIFRADGADRPEAVGVCDACRRAHTTAAKGQNLPLPAFADKAKVQESIIREEAERRVRSRAVEQEEFERKQGEKILALSLGAVPLKKG